MFTRTRIPKHLNSVCFTAQRSSKAFRLANQFLNGKGRIANAIDIAKARVTHGFDHPIWQRYVTSSSTEWFGLNKTNEPVIVVLHDPAPFFNQEWLDKHYSYDIHDPNRLKHEFNVVSRKMFLEVLDGKYGTVQQIPLQEVIDQENENKHQYSYMTRHETETNKLFNARIGTTEIAKAYLEVHQAGSKHENKHDWLEEGGNAIIKCIPAEYFPHFVDIDQTVKGWPKKIALRRAPINLKKEAVAHFITFGAVCNVGGRVSFTASEIDLSKTNANCGFLAIVDEKEDVRLGKRISGYRRKGYLEFLSRLFVPHVPKDNEDYYQIGSVNDWYFTQRFREKIPIGDEQVEWFVTIDPTFSAEGEQKYLVKSLQPLGQRTIKVSIEQGFYTYEMVKALFDNIEANAFEVINGFKKVEKDYVAVIRYYKADVYTDRIIPTEIEILSDRKLLGRFI